MVQMRHIMLKPASGMCNLRCEYCFYTDETSKRAVPSRGMMSEETLSNILRRTLSDVTKECTIAFQGGEPMLAGLPFFRLAAELTKEYNVNNCRVNFALQTNGTLLDDEWCKFLKENDFLVGISLDGVRDTHDMHRLDAQGKGTYTRVLRGIRLLEENGVEFNILTVLTGSVCRAFRRINDFYTRQGWEYRQYIPCLDPLEEERGGHPWSLTPERFGQYLKTAFDCWYHDIGVGKKTYHRYFDNLLRIMRSLPPEACGMLGRCTLQYVIEADGSVYPCDFYMLDRYLLGNLNEQGFGELDKRRSELMFIGESAMLPEECVNCRYRPLCRGGCRRDRDYFERGLGVNYYCEAYKSFFDYAFPRLQALAAGMR